MENLTKQSNEVGNGPLVLKFESEKTVGEVYEYTIDSIDKAFGVIVALASPELLRQAQLRLGEFKARVENAQAKLSGRVLERASFEELAAASESSSVAWTMENGKRVTLDEMEGR